jgi:segregation and condensation protein B
MTVPFEERLVEALLFASAEPVALAEIADRLSAEVDVRAVLATLAARYQDRGVQLVERDGAYAFRTAEDLGPALRQGRVHARKVTRAQIEALAIIAYHEPTTRAEIEEIRGVALGKGTLDALLEAGWIRPRGRKQVPGRPVLWATTPAFLDHFGLTSRDDLPGIEDLKAAGLLERRAGVTLAMRVEEAGDDEPS